MDGVGLRFPGDADDLGNGEIGGDRAETPADLVGLVCLEAVEGELVLLGEHRDGLQPQLVGRPENPDGDLGPVRNEDFLDRHDAPNAREVLQFRANDTRIVQLRKEFGCGAA
jgi:hypothetical protein